MARTIFEIDQGQLGFAVVDKAAPGYSDAWQAPGGATVDTVTLADYDAESQQWTCQTSAGALTATQDTTTRDVPATFCLPGETIPAPKATSYSLDVTFLQDPNVARGLSRFLFEHDTEEAYVYFGLDGDNPPRMIGRVKLAAGTIGGPARETLTADVSLALTRKPDIEFGDATTSEVVEGGGGVAATGATAGTPGTWTPTGATAPANAAAATGAGIVATPATAWTTGQYMQGSTAGTGGEMHWSGTAWATGKAT